MEVIVIPCTISGQPIHKGIPPAGRSQPLLGHYYISVDDENNPSQLQLFINLYLEDFVLTPAIDPHYTISSIMDFITNSDMFGSKPITSVQVAVMDSHPLFSTIPLQSRIDIVYNIYTFLEKYGPVSFID